MKTRTTHLLAAATLTGILLTGTACGAPQAAPEASATTTAAATAEAAEPSATPTATTSAAAPAPAPVPEAPRAAALKTFTFPDGHISFTHPAGWTVKTKQGHYLTEETKAGAVDATVLDESGAEVAFVGSGDYGGGAAAPTKRIILDSVPTGIVGRDGGTAFGFVYDTNAVDASFTHYAMGVRRAEEFQPGYDSSGSSYTIVPNGAMSAEVIFGKPAFASLDAAKAWMGTEQYAQLKALLLSVTYK